MVPASGSSADASQLADTPETRLAYDGRTYTKREFLEWYGDAGESLWAFHAPRRYPIGAVLQAAEIEARVDSTRTAFGLRWVYVLRGARHAVAAASEALYSLPLTLDSLDDLDYIVVQLDAVIAELERQEPVYVHGLGGPDSGEEEEEYIPLWGDRWWS